MTLKTQPTKMPTRKLAAVIIATFLVQGVLGVGDIFMPGLSRMIPAADYIAMLVPLLAGYMTKDKA
jgi:hypothetical protein